jgi:hypothetical protein
LTRRLDAPHQPKVWRGASLMFPAAPGHSRSDTGTPFPICSPAQSAAPSLLRWSSIRLRAFSPVPRLPSRKSCGEPPPSGRPIRLPASREPPRPVRRRHTYDGGRNGASRARRHTPRSLGPPSAPCPTLARSSTLPDRHLENLLICDGWNSAPPLNRSL